ncbi:hypothetical protein IMCC20628_01714 [Hoeflea sp. IMCC20628]|uniref:hypothetical protein n=1 Tax=Hoeflea sp. IMCC20628 TaxID=1620421 RepID=UPI00063AFC04|nr:hypothetical protein [Hoeflea sp. IMCC20628]AKI00427.1 hypothetical protein IMCC20628_01714 [Hoeflea sp. IMCC20628]
MEHIAAFMLLIACSDDRQACSEQPAPAVAYETVQQCELELSPAIASISQIKEKSFGKCVEVDPALFYEDAEIVWDVTSAGGIEVAVQLINPDMDINEVAQAPQSDNQTPASRFN